MKNQRVEISFIAKLIFLNSQRRLLFEEEDLKALEYVSNNLNILKEKLNNTNENNIQELFGGEFSLSYKKNGNDLIDMNLDNSIKIPLFLILDLSKTFLEIQYIENPYTSEKVKNTARNLIPIIEDLRKSFSELEYNSMFNSKKHISDEIIRVIKNDIQNSHSSGIEYIPNYSFKKRKEFDKSYVTLTKDISTSQVTYHSGEPLADKPSYSENQIILFEEDQKEIDKKRKEEYLTKLEERKKLINPIIKKYFNIEKLPEKGYDQLIDYLNKSNIDNRLIYHLKSLVHAKEESDRKNFFNRDAEFLLSREVEKIITNIVNIEELIKKEEQEKHNTSIEEARKRYREKSFLWKLLNRKLNPDLLNLDTMDDKDIDALYKK